MRDSPWAKTGLRQQGVFETVLSGTLLPNVCLLPAGVVALILFEIYRPFMHVVTTYVAE